MLTCLFPKETTPSRSTEIPFYFAPIKFHERKNDSNPLSLVQASGFPLHRHGYTVVIKLKGSAISLPRLPPPNIVQKADTYWKDRATTCPHSFRGTHSIRMDTRIECQTEDIRFVERRKLIPLFKPLAPVLFEYPRRSALFLLSPDSKILLSHHLSYDISGEIVETKPGIKYRVSDYVSPFSFQELSRLQLFEPNWRTVAIGNVTSIRKSLIFLALLSSVYSIEGGL